MSGQMPQGDRAFNRRGNPVQAMSADERRALVEQLSHEVADWSAELNRRLA